MLSMTKVVLEFVPDLDIYMFFEKSMRGEVACISKSV